MAALPRRFPFIKHKADGSFSQALGTAESPFLGSQREENGRGTRDGTATAFVQFLRQKEDGVGGLKR